MPTFVAPVPACGTPPLPPKVVPFPPTPSPPGDLAVALGALLIVLVLSGGALSVPWMVIATGFLVVSVADLLFSYATWNEVYLAGSNAGVNLITALSDVPYYASYVILAFGIYTQARLQKPGGRGTV